MDIYIFLFYYCKYKAHIKTIFPLYNIMFHRFFCVLFFYGHVHWKCSILKEEHYSLIPQWAIETELFRQIWNKKVNNFKMDIANQIQLTASKNHKIIVIKQREERSKNKKKEICSFAASSHIFLYDFMCFQ